MTINRRDTILIAVLMNVGLLTLLFITSINFSGEAPPTLHERGVQQVFTPLPLPEEPAVVKAEEAPRDELDQMLLEMQRDVKAEIAEEVAPQKVEKEEIQISVKKGDTLEKIAKANKTTVSALRRLNNLPNDKLKIGQRLVVPRSGDKGAEPVALKEDSGAVYYEVQSGDSPWKIAKKLNMNYDTILKLNNMDEARARNLKVGDKIRVK